MTASEEQPPRPSAHSAHRAQLTFREEAQPFLNVFHAVGKTVSNIPVRMVAGIERQARTLFWPRPATVPGCLALATQHHPSA